MTREEVKQLLEALRRNYRKEFANFTQNDFSEMLNDWSLWLANNDAQKTFVAVQTIITTDPNPFAPNIAQINEKINELFKPKGLTEQEAWSKLYYAICNSGYGAKQRWEALPKDIQDLCTPQQLYDWSQMDTDTLNSVVSSNFMRSYKVRNQETKQYDKLPNQTKNLIESIKGDLKLENKNE